MALTGGSLDRLRLGRLAVLILFASMPVAFVSGLVPLLGPELGPHPWLSHWFWAPAGVLAAAAAVIRPPGPPALRAVLPYLAFLLLATASLLWTKDVAVGLDVLIRMTALVLFYWVGWQTAPDTATFVNVRAMATAWMALLAVAYLTYAVEASRPAEETAVQQVLGTTALNMVVLFVYATLGRPQRTTVAVGLLIASVLFVANARMAAVVTVLLILVSPRWQIPKRARVAAGLAAGGLFAFLVSFPYFGGEWFNAREGTVWDVVTVSQNLDLSGRRMLWQGIVERCSGNWIVGRGVGSSNVFANSLMPPIDDPHNEYLRTMCDEGVIGSLLLWSFLLLIALRAMRTLLVARRSSAVPWAALQLSVAFLLLGITDIPLTATIQFLAPASVVWGWSDRTHASLLGPADMNTKRRRKTPR